jgi:hypothetical protein
MLGSSETQVSTRRQQQKKLDEDDENGASGSKMLGKHVDEAARDKARNPINDEQFR